MSLRNCFFLSALISVTYAIPTSAEFGASSNPAAGCPADFFTQKAVVFDAVTICATREVSREKLAHAANVAAEWLDNDENGTADEPALIRQLQHSNPVLVMSEHGFPNRTIRKMQRNMGDRVGQDLAADETSPTDGDRDASQEEIHHLILNAGWRLLYPEVFSEDPAVNSALFQAWELAESSGHYDYDDPTCDPGCKVGEYFYLATAAYLGAEADLESDEMRVKTRENLKEKLPETVAVIEDRRYQYPRNHWPDGDYKHRQNIHTWD